jgi:hypothetical protein
VAGNADAAVHFDLVSTQGKQLANLTVRSRIAGAEVRIDDKPVGKTPLQTSVTLLAGHHAVELRRPGYKSSRQEVDVGAGATGELSFDLSIDPSQLGTEGAMLAIDSTEPSPVIFVDDEHRGPYTEPLRLPRGPHHLRIEHAGFLPIERNVTLDQGQTSLLHVDLIPTPEKRASYESSAKFHRTWGIIGIISGVAIAGGGTAWLFVNKSSKDDALAEYNRRLAIQASSQYSDGRAIRPCATLGPPANDPHPNDLNSTDQCNTFVDEAKSAYDSAKSKDVVGYVGIGVGGALAVTGLILLLTGDDPSRYDRPPQHKLDGKAFRPHFGFAPGPGQLGGALQVVF